MNQVIGYLQLSEQKEPHRFKLEESFSSVSKSDNGSMAQRLQVLCRPKSTVQVRRSEKENSYAYIWGIPVHPDISAEFIPEWCVEIVKEKEYSRFKELVGTFVVIVDEPKHRKTTFITDILGIRPFFYGYSDNRLVFGSDVWAIHSAGMSDGKIDYDSVSAWVTYGFNSTEGSLFSNLSRFSPGSVTTIHDGKHSELQYAKFESEFNAPKIEQVSDEIHDIVSSTVNTLLNTHNTISLPLSGGFDSRYLLSLSMLNGGAAIDCATVGISDSEKQIAHQVAEILNIPLRQTYNVKGSIWDLYDDVYHFMADGFPITKFVPYRIAQDYSGIPMMNGFMGDALIRGDSDKYLGMYETEWKDDPVDVLQRKHTRTFFQLFKKDFGRKALARSRPSMERAVREGMKLGKIMTWQDFYYTHRFYISNNFLQHLGLAEALIPFYSWRLLSYKMKHDYRVFNMTTYEGIFQKYFPKLSSIPRAVETAKSRKPPNAKCSKMWAREIMPDIVDRKRLTLLYKRLCMPLNLAGMVGITKAEKAIFNFRKLYLLEKKTRESGVDFDWEML